MLQMLQITVALGLSLKNSNTLEDLVWTALVDDSFSALGSLILEIWAINSNQQLYAIDEINGVDGSLEP